MRACGKHLDGFKAVAGDVGEMLAAQTRVGTGYYLPTVYAAVFAFTLLSGIHYVFFVSKLVNEDRRSEGNTLN